MRRRDFLRGSAFSLAAPSVVCSEQSTDGPLYTPPKDRFVTVQMTPDDDDPRWEFYPKYRVLWADVDLQTGHYDLLEADDPMYAWPLANWWCNEIEFDDSEWDGIGAPSGVLDGYPWKECYGRIFFLAPGMRGIIPRYVKAPRSWDIFHGLVPRYNRDRRDDLSIKWVNVDLLTGHYVECAPDDRIYDVYTTWDVWA
ncbi:hypothetical protein KT71_08540 [Congregibacter litoralis KT71]|uniref:Uncharacterized protein n=1 Tax=Congregibacter litoralis KT71 TaxID=314285 RepID=A4AD37_9GAMM|nr:hypothetical protein KT71_08540 [Congregibacter litoralis KT71]